MALFINLYHILSYFGNYYGIRSSLGGSLTLGVHILIMPSICRIHGIAVAEMPLIATCSRYRRQGMCRRLMIAIEKVSSNIAV